MRQARAAAAALALLMPALAFSAVQAHQGSYSLRIDFLKPIDDSSWRVHVELRGPGLDVGCTGVLRPNIYYIETRDISRSLVAAPLYYILDTVCPQAAARLESISRASGGAPAVVTVNAPRGYLARSAMDWRGYGPPGGPYRVPLRMLARYYVFDSVVVADASSYHVVDNSSTGLTIIYSSRLPGKTASYAAHVVAVVRSLVSQWLGPSPRSPVLVVLVDPKGQPLQLPKSGHSTGGMVYIKTGLLQVDLPWLVHTAAHETVHGWLNSGLLGGDFSLEEAATEFLALKALHDADPRLYSMAVSYVRGSIEAGDAYATWMRMNAALRYAGVHACGTDLYTRALRQLFNSSLAGGGKPVSLLDLIRTMLSLAPPGCRKRLKASIGPALIAAASRADSWPFIDIEVFEDSSTSASTPATRASSPPRTQTTRNKSTGYATYATTGSPVLVENPERSQNPHGATVLTHSHAPASAPGWIVSGALGVALGVVLSRLPLARRS